MHRITTICIIVLSLQALTSVKCQVTECTRQQFVESSDYDRHFDTSVLEATYPLKRQVRVPCSIGYAGFFKLTCTENGWKTVGSPCQAKSCGHPGDAQYADFQLETGDDFVFGSTVVYTCHKGYRMVSRSNRRRCMADGWDGHIPTCEAVKCQSLTVNDKILVTGDPEDGTYGNVIRFSCKSRREILKGPTEIYCDESGEWSGEVPECREVTCDTPQIVHGRVTDRPKVYKEDDYLTFVCDNNYKPADERRSRCIKVGSEAVWSPTPQCLLIQCKVNLPPIQGTTFNRYDRNVFSPGDTLTVTCEGDRWIVDMKTTRTVVTCKDNGDWDITPECKDITCHEDRRDQYLYSFYVPWGQTKVNGRATYSCKYGYKKPHGVTHATCTRDGWMPERLCEGTTCSEPDFEHGEQITSGERTSYRNGDRLTYECNRISVTITCEQGSWTGIKSCLEMRCVKPIIPNGFAVGPHDNTVYYSCNQNYKLFSKVWWGVAKCIKGVWSEFQKCIEMTECGETPEISNGRVESKDNQRATINCNEGYQTEVNEITCDNGEWDLDERNYTNICTRISEPCEPPPKVQNAVIETPYLREYVSGSQIIYKCRDNYRLGQDKSIRCLNGQWEEKRISCTPFCNELKDDNLNVQQSLIKQSYMNGETIDYTCTYDEENEGTATCDEGKWNKTIQCPGPPCNVPKLGPGLRSSPITFKVKSGGKLSLYCLSGFELEGANEIECLDTGDWNSAFPTCTKTCEMPNIPQILRLMTPVEGGRAKKGQKLKFECSQRGKFLQGNAEIECLESGGWSDQLPKCGDKRLCSPPPSIEDGDIMRTKPEYQEGETVEYVCPRYYKMEGGPRLTCRNGQWTGRVRCISPPCNVPKLGPGLRSSPTISKVKSGGKISLFCNSGFELEGANEIECLDRGDWSSAFPTCTKTCEMPNIPQILRMMTPVEGGRAKKGQKLRFECSQRGKFLQGNAEIECLESGGWSDQPPRCGDKRLCSPPPQIEDGDIMRTKPEYQEGETVEYVCPRFYVIEGGPRLTCRNGQWTGRVRCIKPCTVTKEEMDRNNLVFLKDWIHKIYSEHNDHLTFRCKSGKRHDGRVTMRQQCIEGVIQLPTCV
uniref:Sushi domain-containing protein n=1 Tax=Oryzias latipes TaxID=8090 RepID=A0A3P9K5I7_ORYLA